MILLLSPAKKLDFSSPKESPGCTQAEFLGEARYLVDRMRTFSPDGLSRLMKISESLGQLNYDRFIDWDAEHDSVQAKQAILAFRGDVYRALCAERFTNRDMDYAQDHLRILSGLYGVLRPLDMIRPYRLEMGTRLHTERGKCLYDFWGDKITLALQNASVDGVLLNLASQEYYGAVRPDVCDLSVYTPAFKDRRGADFRIISFYAKKARGAMAAWVIRNQVDKPRQLRDFSWNGYQYAPDLSSAREPVFTRDAAVQ